MLRLTPQEEIKNINGLLQHELLRVTHLNEQGQPQYVLTPKGIELHAKMLQSGLFLDVYLDTQNSTIGS